MIAQRIIELEIKLSYQEDLLTELNKIVALQQQKIDSLEKLCKLLYERMDDLLLQEKDSVPKQKPPHY